MNSRNYNEEHIDNKQRNYTYKFDLDVMHKYMIEAFKPYFVNGNALELGCYKGDFTKRLNSLFSDLTCIEASSDAIKIAKENLNSKNIKFINGMFENVKLNKNYDNIFLTHVLEHIDDRVGLLDKIKKEWLSEKGHLFIACPNANAASRQIAVFMGLIDSPESITPGEYEHGHRITYTLETLKKDIELSGLKIKHSSGIFFKALANFQWDKLLEENIVSNEYLDACVELGKKYPELCSSIYFICSK